MFVEAVLGSEWAMKLADNYGAPRGTQPEAVHNPGGNNQYARVDKGYAHNLYPPEDKPERGTRKVYLAERIAKEYPDEIANIGKGKKYKTVHEAARKLRFTQAGGDGRYKTVHEAVCWSTLCVHRREALRSGIGLSPPS